MTVDVVTSDPEPVIIRAALAAGHDGLAEVAIVVRYPNGAERGLTLPYDTVGPALDRSGVTNLTDLVGRPWTALWVHDAPTKSNTEAGADR